MQNIDVMIEPEPQSEDQFLEILRSTSPSPMREWWNSNLQPLLDKLDEQLGGQYDPR